MKRILAIAIAFMYLAITSGLVLQVHYCMGKQSGASVALAEKEHHTCGKCGMQNGKSKCCHDEVKLVKLQDEHQQVASGFQCAAPLATTQEFNCIEPRISFSAAPIASGYTPPDDDQDTGDLPLFILHGVFRI